MTPDEFDRALLHMTEDQWQGFLKNEGYGSGDRANIPNIVRGFGDHPEQEARLVHLLRRVGVTDVETESEKALAVARAADQRTKTAGRAAGWAAALSILSIIVTIALNRGC